MKAIAVKDICKAYERNEVVKSVSLNIKPGRIIGLVGPNGAGKTTLMMAISGMITADSGSIDFMQEANVSDHNQKVAYMSNNNFFHNWMSVKDTISFYQRFFKDFNVTKAKCLVEECGLDLRKKIHKLSHGNQKKLSVILTLCRKCELYLLDEPLNGIDLLSRHFIINLLLDEMNENKCILVASHLIKECEKYLDDVIILDNGSVVLEGDVENLRLKYHASLHTIYKKVI